MLQTITISRYPHFRNSQKKKIATGNNWNHLSDDLAQSQESQEAQVHWITTALTGEEHFRGQEVPAGFGGTWDPNIPKTMENGGKWQLFRLFTVLSPVFGAFPTKLQNISAKPGLSTMEKSTRRKSKPFQAHSEFQKKKPRCTTSFKPTSRT